MTRFLFVLLLASAIVPLAAAQTFVRSTLPINSAPVLQQSTAYGAVNNSVLLVGQLSSARQSAADIVSVDASGSIECLHNNGDGTFNEPVVSQVGLALPLSVAHRVNFGGTDSIVIGGPSSLELLTFANCSATASAQIPVTNVLSVSDVIPNLVNGDPGILLLTPAALYTFDTTTQAVALASIPPAPAIPGNPPATPSTIGGQIIQAGAFGPYQFSLVQVPPNSGGASSSFIMGNITAGNLSIAANGFQDFSGAQFTGFVSTSSGIAVGSWTNCSGCNEAQIFLDSILFDSEGQSSVTPITSFDLPGVPAGIVAGNFLGDGTDLAVATNVNQTVSNNVFWYRYIAGQTPMWNQYASNINAGGPISAVNHGMLVSGSDFVVTIVGSNAVAFGTSALSEDGAPPPAQPSITITPSSQTGSAGTTFQYQFNLANFLTVPSVVITCPVPEGTCTNNGTALVVTTTAPSAAVIAPISRIVRLQSILMIAMAIGLCLFMRRRSSDVVRGIAFAGVLICLASCGSSSSPAVKSPAPISSPPSPAPGSSGTASGTYTITMTAGTASSSVQLTIQ